MAIKVSSLLESNTTIVVDSAPTLGGALNTNGFPITNGVNPVVIAGNEYPVTTGLAGQVLTTDGTGQLSWQTVSGSGGPISLTGAVTGTGTTSISTTISATGVSAGVYGSSSNTAVVTVNSAGQITNAVSAPISILPSQAGLSNVSNNLQVINAGGAPSIQEGAGPPTGPAALGALYVDQFITNGNSIYRSNSTTWDVIAVRPNLYAERVNGFTTPVAQAPDSVAIGSGAETQIGANNSLAIGMQSVARLQGGIVQASGRFSNNGDAQAGRYLLRGTTISNAPQELLIDGTGGNKRLALSDNSTWTFKVTVTAHRTDLGDGHAGYTAAGVIYRGSGANTTNIQGAAQKTVLAESNPAWDINITADAVYGSLKITVTGENGKIIRWVALIETVEVTN